MPDAAQTGLLPAREVARTTPLVTAANGLTYASFGYTEVPADSLSQIVEAVPPTVAATLRRHAYYFVPLALGESEETEIARGFTTDLGDRATCHRNLVADNAISQDAECTFISARLMQDRFALAFEFFINIGHQMVDVAGVPRQFQDLAWAQARADVRGETSQDAYEARMRAVDAAAMSPGAPVEAPQLSLSGPQPGLEASAGNGSSSPTRGRNEARVETAAGVSLFASRDPGGTRSSLSNSRSETQRALTSRFGSSRPVALPQPEPLTHISGEQDIFFEAAFADTLAIYMLSLAMDLDYADLREREYPLLAAPALAERLRLASELFPPAPGYEFSIRYRRRH
jgi:hypothetical protein